MAFIFAWALSKLTAKHLKNSYHKYFAVAFCVLVSFSLIGEYKIQSNKKIDFIIWITNEASEENRELAYKIHDKLFTSTLSKKEAELFISLLLDFFEYRGITREEIKKNPDFAKKYYRRMNVALADYQLAVANSMLKSWDKGYYTVATSNGGKDLAALAEEIKTYNPIFDERVQMDMRMIEFAAQRHTTFFASDSLKEEAVRIFSLVSVPPLQEKNNESTYILSREIIIHSLKKFEQSSKNIQIISGTFDDWFSQ